MASGAICAFKSSESTSRARFSPLVGEGLEGSPPLLPCLIFFVEFDFVEFDFVE